MEWAPLKLEGLPPGIEIAALSGDLAKGGGEILLRTPPKYAVPKHSHTSDELYVWLKGSFTYIAADGTRQRMDAPAYISLPGQSAHALECGYLRYGRPFDLHIHDMRPAKLWEAPDVLAAGKHTLEYDFKYDGLGFATLAFNSISGLGRGGTGTFKVDGKVVVSTQTLERTVPLTLPWDETFDIGSDTGTPVDDQDYQVPFAFTGKINRLTFTIEPPVLTADDKRKLQEAYRAAQDAN